MATNLLRKMPKEGLAAVRNANEGQVTYLGYFSEKFQKFRLLSFRKGLQGEF